MRARADSRAGLSGKASRNDGDRAVERRAGRGAVAARFGDQRAFHLDLAAQPAGRSHPPVADLGQPLGRLDQPRLGLGELALLAKRDAAQFGRLRIEDRGALGRGQAGAQLRQFLDAAAFAIDHPRQRQGDRAGADFVARFIVGDGRHRLVERK